MVAVAVSVGVRGASPDDGNAESDAERDEPPGLPPDVTVTVAESETPLHVMVKVVVFDGAIEREPLVGLLKASTASPSHALPKVFGRLALLDESEETQAVVFVDDHVSVVDPPGAIEVGDAVSLTVGADDADPTVTVTDFVSEPPTPVHVMVKVVVFDSVTDIDPFAAFPP